MRYAVAAAGLIALLACSDDPAGPSLSDVAGTYQLAQFQGASVPALLPGTSPAERIVTLWSGELLLRTDLAFAITTVEREATATTFEERVTHRLGTFIVSGRTITFTEPGAPPYVGEARNDGVTVTIAGVTYLFRR